MIRNLITSLLVILSLGTFIMPAASIYAVDSLNGVCSNGAAGASDVCQGRTATNPLTGANGLLKKISLIVAGIAGLAAVIVIILSALNYITSNGDPSKAASAKNGIIYAVAGLIVIAISESIVSIILSRI